jgi:hypothetical protein
MKKINNPCVSQRTCVHTAGTTTHGRNCTGSRSRPLVRTGETLITGAAGISDRQSLIACPDERRT